MTRLDALVVSDRRLLSQLRPAIVLVALFTALLGLLLPLGFVQFARVVMPFRAGGSLIERDGKIVGSALIGQNWTADIYLQGRPSATMAPDPADASKSVPAPYNAGSSGGSNAGPTSKALLDRVASDVARLGGGPVLGDAVTTSASGLDPHVSPAYAARQVTRIAAARHVSESQVRAVIAAHTQGRLMGVIGEERVDVLAVNLALDASEP